jgi:hypothetical protein
VPLVERPERVDSSYDVTFGLTWPTYLACRVSVA